MSFLLGPTLTPMKNKKEYFGKSKKSYNGKSTQTTSIPKKYHKNIIKTSFKISIWNIHV